MEHEIRHLSEVQKKNIEDAVRTILKNIGENPEREGLLETPERVARMFDEIFEGLRWTNRQIADECNKTFPAPKNSGSQGGLVSVTGIDAFSYCEHHMALMYNMKVNVAYIPRKKIIGLSKIPRVVEMVTKRLQLQEKIGEDIAEILSWIVETEDVMVVISGEHACLTTRGVRKPGAVTKTICARGAFKNSESLRKEFLTLINEGGV